jgi:hypothetical protein
MRVPASPSDWLDLRGRVGRAREVRRRLRRGRIGFSWSRLEYDGEWEIPVFGAVSAPAALLIRPDGHVAWVGDGTDAGLPEALTTWFGAQTAA